MPEATSTDINDTNHVDNATASTPLELLKAVKEVQERRIAIWREYDDAFNTFLDPSSSSSSSSFLSNTKPVNGSLNIPFSSSSSSQSVSHSWSIQDQTVENNGPRCVDCSNTTVPISENLLVQILQITTQALIECGHRLRTIQTELNHSSAPKLGLLVDKIQINENKLLRCIVHRDQLRKLTLNSDQHQHEKSTITQLDQQVNLFRQQLSELIQDVYAESVELQLPQAS
ncbi:uncharacterized protein MEPE_02198 [Melanopsichium pennsylvanicum]|uniref:Uncharacterized protein n=1 Tax=Melanopsichium pennsylvanicum TaxID=63383 RepID=A0AAJ5C4A4_9BASI|nr:uncharacterized protein MEPE_02198 [Melanopsichium pennsylvanicum]